MLKFFFHRDSKFVRVVEAVGAALFIPMVIKEHGSWALWLYLFEYAFIRFSYNFNWYRSFKEGTTDESGIRLHFKKALVATAYIIFILNLGLLLTGSRAFIYTGVFLLSMVLYLHCVLLYLHFRDKDERPPNYFSTGRPL